MEFNLVEKLLSLTLFGAEWVLWLLIFLSILSVAIMLERIVYFTKIRINFETFTTKLGMLLSEKKYDEALKFCETSSSIEAKAAKTGILARTKGHKTMEGAMEGVIASQKQELDKGLVVLGTLGNNAPFVGLFGTVIGIIKAFHDLSNHPEGGPSVVMAGISEALVATAVGLLVAIPAVVAFNTFNRMVKKRIASSQAIAKIVLTYE